MLPESSVYPRWLDEPGGKHAERPFCRLLAGDKGLEPIESVVAHPGWHRSVALDPRETSLGQPITPHDACTGLVGPAFCLAIKASEADRRISRDVTAFPTKHHAAGLVVVDAEMLKIQAALGAD